MGEVLSQNEIDSLLQALSSGELDAEDMKVKDEKQVKNYDFTRPAKFSKEHLRTLEIIFEHYVRLLSTNLPVYLRKSVQVELMSSEAVTYQEFSNALSNPVLLGLVGIAPLKGNIIIELFDICHDLSIYCSLHKCRAERFHFFTSFVCNIFCFFGTIIYIYNSLLYFRWRKRNKNFT